MPDKRKHGSSPHAWGTDPTLSDDRIFHRFIPTCVGNCAGGTGGISATSVHPHMRGELAVKTLASVKNDGSSPHAWGTDEIIEAIEFLERFIPTCVGNCNVAGS